MEEGGMQFVMEINIWCLSKMRKILVLIPPLVRWFLFLILKTSVWKEWFRNKKETQRKLP
jgi:uncharacterized protein HemY